MKARIKLRSKKDNSIVFSEYTFDTIHGVQFIYDRSAYRLESINQSSEMFDINKKEIFNKDYVEATVQYHAYEGKKKLKASKLPKVFGSVVFDLGCFCIDIIEKENECGYDVGQKIPLFNFESIEIKSV